MANESAPQKPSGPIDYIALVLTTFGVGYIPGAPGTYGSIVGVAIYLLVGPHFAETARHGLQANADAAFINALHYALVLIAIVAFILLGIWASGRSVPIFGTDDPHEAVVDEVM